MHEMLFLYQIIWFEGQLGFIFIGYIIIWLIRSKDIYFFIPTIWVFTEKNQFKKMYYGSFNLSILCQWFISLLYDGLYLVYNAGMKFMRLLI